MKKGLFLDRDGIINKNFGYVHKPEDTSYLDGIGELINVAKKNNFYIIVITNQSGIARGFYTENQFHSYMNWMKKDLNEKFSNTFDSYYYCPHHPKEGKNGYLKNCSCRKPGKLLFEIAYKNHNINLSNSLMLGDSLSDIEASIKVGIKKNFILSEKKFYNAISIKKVNDFKLISQLNSIK